MDKYFKILMLLQYIIPFSVIRKKYRAFIKNKHENYIFYKNGNKIILLKDNEKKEATISSIKGLRISVLGKCNTILLTAPYFFCNTDIIINGNDNIVEIKKVHPTGIHNTVFQLGAKANNRKIFINEDFSCSGINFGLNISNYSISIGKDCMFSNEIVIDADDGHVIFKEGTKECINVPQDVIIGDHVWCGRRVLICKGVVIPGGSIIGEGSIVNKKFTNTNTIIAGVPAKVVKQGVQWERYNHNKILNTSQTLVAVERERERERERVIPLVAQKINNLANVA